MADMRATTFNNRVLVTGKLGKGGVKRWIIIFLVFVGGVGNIGGVSTDFDTILEYMPDTDEWKQVGKMMEAKRSHAVSVVRFEDYSEWCKFPRQGMQMISTTVRNAFSKFFKKAPHLQGVAPPPKKE